MNHIEAMKLALEALEEISSQYMSLPKNGCMALAAIEEALAEQPAQQDLPDVIAGALGVSRGTAYDMMREALAEQPARRKVPAIIQILGHCPECGAKE